MCLFSGAAFASAISSWVFDQAPEPSDSIKTVIAGGVSEDVPGTSAGSGNIFFDEYRGSETRGEGSCVSWVR